MTQNGQRPKLLLIDDDQAYRKVMARELSRRGFAVTAAADGEQGLVRLRQKSYDIVLLDLRLPDIDGLTVLQRAREQGCNAEIVMITGHGTIDTAITAIRLGAYHYITKPCGLDEIEVTIQKALEHHRLRERNALLSDALAPRDVGCEFVGASKAYDRILQLVDKVAPTDSTVLILGETGVGKGMVANLIHARSRRRNNPFVVVDCGLCHENLLQSELFGHEKGAFTSATRMKHGLFEVADKGTIFLDEIGDISLEIQSKLLRVLDTSTFRRLGSTVEREVSVRVIAATNKNLQKLIEMGRFRNDLYYRLSTIQIEIPPLRQRREDIDVLIDYRLEHLNRENPHRKEISPEARQALREYSWPGTG